STSRRLADRGCPVGAVRLQAVGILGGMAAAEGGSNAGFPLVAVAPASRDAAGRSPAGGIPGTREGCLERGLLSRWETAREWFQGPDRSDLGRGLGCGAG